MSLVAASGARWLRAALAATGCALAACSGATLTPPPSSLGLVRDGRGAGPDIAHIAQPAGDSLQLALWLDAGARDAQPPQVATLAAWLAAEAAGGNVQAQVFPDGIELTAPCRKRELAACLGRLQRGLSMRRPELARFAAARDRLIAARRAAQGADAARDGDRLALQALYGAEHAAGLFPLGDATDDAQATAERTAEFFARHFGPERALVVAVGELDGDALAEATARAFARSRRATHARASHRGLPEAEDGVTVDVADVTAISLALAAPSTARAHAAAAALKARLEREPLGLPGPVRGHVFEVRGGALALLRVPSRDPQDVVHAAAHEIERLRHEGLPAAIPARSAAHLPLSQARRLGLRWIVQGAPGSEGGLALGAGVLVAGGRADAIAKQHPDAALRERSDEQLQAAFAAGVAHANPPLDGDVADDAASVTLDNGARVEIRQRAGEQVAIAVRFARGAGDDPPTLHGRTALLATLTATACAGLSAEQLSTRLHELGADLQSRVDARSWGITLTAPSASWQAALVLALDCALHPALERRHLSSARLRLSERLGPEGGPGELHAAVAEQLWPSAPGALAPWGSPARQASVSLAAVRELWLQSRRGPAVSVGVVGAVPAEVAASWAARRVAQLAAKATVDAAPQPPTPVQNRVTIDQPTLGLALWRVQSVDSDPAGAQAFAAIMRAALAQVPGVAAVWHGGGVAGDGGWAAVGLSGAPEPLAGAASALREAARVVSAETLTRAADQAFGLAERTRAAAASDPTLAAEALARAALQPAQESNSLERARALAASLARAEPQWLPLR